MSYNSLVRRYWMFALGGLFVFNIVSSSITGRIDLNGTTDNLSVTAVTKEYLQAKPGSTVSWYVTDSNGGTIVKGNAVASIILLGKQRNIKTTFNIRGYCHSMCGLLASTADKIVVDNNVPFIFHAIQLNFLFYHGVDTKSSLFKAHMRFWNPYVKRILNATEYQAMMEGKDVIVFGNRIKAAINRK